MESNMMQTAGEGCLDIAELASQLSREKIFINSERQHLQYLNEQAEKNALELLQVAWICSQQRNNLANLLAAKSETESIIACQRASLLEDTVFIDVYKVLKYKEANALAELLGWLRDSPHLVALCLLLGEEHMPPNLIPSLVAGLYGSCQSPDDRTRLLAVIRSLIKHQMVPSSDPRKLFITGRGALVTLYSVFRDGHTPARQFLVSVLQGPVMAVLHEDEFFLDIDPDKAMERFSHSDRLKKFGQPNSQEYTAKVARYRKWAIQSLYNLTSKFIASMKENWSSFPSSIAWIVQQMVHLLKQHANTPERELHALCSDLILTQYICPAIINPEAHGIVDVPVSYVARFNLMQIAQIIQTLCRAKYQEIEVRVRDVYARFEAGCVWALVEGALAESAAPAAPAPPAPAARLPPRPPRALYTPIDAHHLITFLKTISSQLNNNTPSVTSEDLSSGSAPNDAGAISESSSDSSLESGGSRLAALLHTVEPNYRARLHDLLPNMPDFTNLRLPSTPKEPSNAIENGSTPKRSILAKVPKPRLPRSASTNSALSLEDRPSNGEQREERERIQVLVIKLASNEEQDYVGMEPESKVLECYYGGSEAGDNDDAASALATTGPPPVQKRTRFSVSHDEVSLGNTSDNLEAVSEAASNHSVTSSLELETEDQNDNLSDMVSANVSGRGSPNISGRETPSSQVTDNDAPPRRPVPQLPLPGGAAAHAQANLKQTRKEIEDKFCKFEIKKLLEGDETISIMSDTWSTDVLASDSETIGDSCDNTQTLANQGPNVSNAIAPDVSETASESAWSVDVLASDSDRNTEADTDDCVSVAARSDTSWPRRPSNQDDFIPIKLINQNGIRKSDMNSPRHTARPGIPNRCSSGYLTATAALSRGGELDVFSSSLSQPQLNENRKSVLINGYPAATGFAISAPESPSTSAPANDLFDYAPPNGSSAASESTLEGTRQSDATSQWVDDSFPSRTPPRYEDNESNDPPSSEGSVADDLVARLASATITTTRLLTSQIRTSVVSISSSRVERKTNEVSMSSLSVNSVDSTSDKSSSQDVNSENVTERRVSPPPKPSTGAIPKSISFDSTAEKSQRRRILGEESLVGNLDELKNNMKRSGGNILNRIKMFRQKGRQQQHAEVKISCPEQEPQQEASCRGQAGDSSEEILAKYRRADTTNTNKKTSRRTSEVSSSGRNMEGVIDLNDPEVFNSMKRKLRMVLSNTDLHNSEYVPNRVTSSSLAEWVRAAAACTAAEAGGAAALAAALAGGGGGARLAAALRRDLAARRPYAAYLASCRAALTHANHALAGEVGRLRGEAARAARRAAAARVLQQLERSGATRRLARHHRAADHRPHNQQHYGGELMDEKVARLMASIKAITAEVKADPSWEGAGPAALEMVEVTVERAAFARLYLHLLFPNGEGDIARDQVLSEHIRRLSGAVSTWSLGVRREHAWAAPYPRAQQLLRHLPVYTAPRDKILCVMRCVRCIMSVLGVDGTAPSADDLTPVLVYVIIKVNPSSLLSTVELVSAWGGASGELLYWWTQFCAAVAYIKTMDYHHHQPE